MYYLIKAVMGFSFFMLFTAAIIYRIDVCQLEVYELILLGSALEISIFVFETPTGVVADLTSRKLSVIIGLFIIGLGFITEALTTHFIVIFAAQVIWGLGYTFISGALDSWISDEEKNKDIEYIYINGAQLDKIFSVLGIITAAIIGTYNIVFAIVLPGLLMISLSFICIIAMKEENFIPEKQGDGLLKAYFEQLFKGLKHIKANNVLYIMLFIMLCYGLYSEGIDRTYELHILDNLNFRTILTVEPIWIIAFVNTSTAIASTAILEVVKRHLDKSKHLAFYAMSFNIVMIFALITFAYANSYIALLGFVIFTVSRQGMYPLLNAIIVKNTPKKIKATILSSFSQLDAIGQLLSGAIMVGLSLSIGISAMYLITALFLVVPCLLYLKVVK